jgi:prolyl oligopeptidase
MRSFLAILPVLALTVSAPRALAATDSFLWLEDIEGARSLEWVQAQNASTENRLENRAIYSNLHDDFTNLLSRSDRLPTVSITNGQVYTFWQDATHLRGLWQRTPLAAYQSGNPQWEVLLDLDALDKAEGKDWVMKAENCLQPENRLCLISLSPGGGDAVEIREFDTVKKAFVEGGFRLSVAKSDVNWLDADTLLVGTDYGPGTMSSSGYPLVIKKWARGTALGAAVEVFRGQSTDMSVSSSVVQQPGVTRVFIQRYLSFFESQLYVIGNHGEQLLLPIPTDADFNAVIGSKVFFTLHSDMGKYKLGSLLSLDLLAPSDLNLVFEPSAKRFLGSVFRSGNDLLLNVLDNVRGKVLRAREGGAGWALTEIPMGNGGMGEVTGASNFDTTFLATYLDFLTPTTQILGDSGTATAKPLRASPAFFDAAGFVTEQLEATSKDGTKVPYFLVHRADQKRDGQNPTLLYGYGGFNVPMTPWYSGSIGKGWLERGGTFVVANIRGGGEFGPAWHEAARREKHQNAFDDFIAVAEDLIARKITSPAHLGIQGGSNGGLLMGAVTMQRPELFRAVLCQVPLLDMMRYHLLLAGASWEDEYGNPEVPTDRDFILKYSPYQNVKPGMPYPEIFFQTSTHDDRVHPGHARKMAALLESMGYGVYFFENNEGGHGGSATPEQQAKLLALNYSYLWGKLAAPAR